MIGYLKGEIKDRGENSLILLVGNVGYDVFVPGGIRAEKNKQTELYVYTHVREDILSLYGFATKEELDFFKLLLSVSGIGPKAALAIISSAPVAKLKDAISQGDSTLLSAVSGVGKKTAEKAVIELKNKVGFSGGVSGVESSDVLDALLGLGFQKQEALGAISKLPAEAETSQEKIKLALKILGNK